MELDPADYLDHEENVPTYEFPKSVPAPRTYSSMHSLSLIGTQ